MQRIVCCVSLLTLDKKISKEQFTFTVDESYNRWCQIRAVISSYSGNAEIFYSSFYMLFQDNLVDDKFDHVTTNNLLAEVADSILTHLSVSHVESSEPTDKSTSLSDKETKCLQ